MSADCDIAIVGGGPVGSVLALALKESGLRITLLEARSGASAEARPIAVAHGSRQLLERLHAWGPLSATPINTVHVSQRGRFGRITMRAAEAELPALGYVLDYIDLFSSLLAAVRQQDADCISIDGARVTAINSGADSTRLGYELSYELRGAQHTLSTRLAVLADGGDIEGVAPPKSVPYEQCAITACVQSSVPHGNTAYERFVPDGPLALLPYGNDPRGFALVWTVPRQRTPELMALDDNNFLRALGSSFGTRVGDFTHVTQRRDYPLHLRYHAHPPAQNVIAIGNAAQTLHPVAGQGFNLGLRDAWELAQLVRQQVRTEPQLNAAELSRRFHAQRRLDRALTIAATHGLVKLFGHEWLPALRGAGMTLLAATPPLKKLFARHMTFGLRT